MATPDFKTFIPMLDTVLEGGVKKNKSVLFVAEPGVNNTIFAYQMFYSRLNQGDHGIYLINNKRTETVKKQFKEYDFDLGNFEQNGIMAFFDCYSSVIGLQSNERFVLENSTDLKEIDDKLLKAMGLMKNNNTLLVFDALSTFIDTFGDGCLEYIEKWLASAEKYNVTPIFLFTKWPYDGKLIEKIKEFFDCIVEVKAIEQKLFLRNYFHVAKATWIKKLEKKEILFKIIKPGGVHVYIPKILVTGPYNAGKTSFVHSASIRAVSVDRIGTTVALDHGQVRYKGLAVDLFGTPGQERFDPIMEILGPESLGVIVVVDSTKPEGFARAKEMIKKSETEGLPMIIVANKADLKGALKPEQIRKKMQLPEQVPIVPIVAADLKKVKKDEPCQLNKKQIVDVLDKLFEMAV